MREFDAGDIVIVRLTVGGLDGHGKTHHVMVLTPKEFNCLGDVLVAPIVRLSDYTAQSGFAISIEEAGCVTRGAVAVNKIRSLRINPHNSTWIETAPKRILVDALARLTAMIEQ